MKRSRLFLWILGILMQAFLISMHFYQRNMEAMYTETEYLLKEVLNEELHRKQLELNMFYVSRIVVDIWGIQRSGFFNGRGKWAKGFENQMV